MTSPYAFNPNDKKYYSCGCHVKKFTILFGILEMFLVCFLIITVLPILNSRLCSGLIKKTYPMSSYANDTLSESKQQQLEKIFCILLFISSLIIFIPAVLFYRQQEGEENCIISFILLIIFIIFLIITLFYALICQLKCCHFIKYSALTGFSLSKIREFHPSSISSVAKRIEPMPLANAVKDIDVYNRWNIDQNYRSMY